MRRTFVRDVGSNLSLDIRYFATCAWDSPSSDSTTYPVFVFDTGMFPSTFKLLDIWLTLLDPPPSLTRVLLTCLSPAERLYASSLRSPSARRAFEVTRATLRLHLARYTGASPCALSIALGPHGKPYLASREANTAIRFNVSHSHRYALLCFSRSHEIGVDIEYITQIPEARHIAARHFSPAEFEYVFAEPTRTISGRFLACWTRKEALVKGLGTGLYTPLEAFDVSPQHDVSAVSWFRPSLASLRWLTASLDLPIAGHCGAVAISPIGEGAPTCPATFQKATRWDSLLTHSSLVDHDLLPYWPCTP